MPAAERRADRVHRRATGTFTDVHRSRDCWTHAGGIRDRRKLDEPHPVRIAVEQIGGEAWGQPRLSATARTGQRQYPSCFEALLCAGEFALPSNERRRLHRKVVWSGLKTAQWGAALRQPVNQELIYALRPHKVLESMLPEVPKREPGSEHVSDERFGRIRDQDLPAVGCRSDASGATYLEANIVDPTGYAGWTRLARMHSHPYAHRRLVRPICFAHAALHRCRCGQRRTRTGENNKE